MAFNPDALLRDLVRRPSGSSIEVLDHHRALALARAFEEVKHNGALVDEDTRLAAVTRMDLDRAELLELARRASRGLLLEAFLACVTHSSSDDDIRARLAWGWAVSDDELPALSTATTATRAAWTLAPALVDLGEDGFAELVAELVGTVGALEALEVLARDRGIRRLHHGDTAVAQELVDVALNL